MSLTFNTMTDDDFVSGEYKWRPWPDMMWMFSMANNAVFYSAELTKHIKNNEVQKNCLFILNKYESTVDQELTVTDAAAEAHAYTLRVYMYPPCGSTLFSEMTSCPSSWKFDAKLKVGLVSRYTCTLYGRPTDLKNISAKFHPDPIWNDAPYRVTLVFASLQ